jgi:hypothetical protein
MNKLVTITGMAALAVMVAACGSSAATSSSAATPAAGQSTAAAAAAVDTPSSAATGSPSSAPTGSAGAVGASSSVAAGASSSASVAAPAPTALSAPIGWCGAVAPAATYSSLPIWLSSAGYQDVQGIETTLANLRAPDQPAAVIQQYGGGLCTGVADAEAIPSPVDAADYTTAMNDLMKASSLLHDPTAANQAAAAPYVSAGTTALDNFLKAVGKPAQA